MLLLNIIAGAIAPISAAMAVPGLLVATGLVLMLIITLID
jgi:hypothetical protein